MKIFAFVLLVSGKPWRLAPFQPPDLSFYEDNGDHGVMLLASLQALRAASLMLSHSSAFHLKT